MCPSFIFSLFTSFKDVFEYSLDGTIHNRYAFEKLSCKTNYRRSYYNCLGDFVICIIKCSSFLLFCLFSSSFQVVLVVTTFFAWLQLGLDKCFGISLYILVLTRQGSTLTYNPSVHTPQSHSPFLALSQGRGMAIVQSC
jgi:hypothetical protein